MAEITTTLQDRPGGRIARVVIDNQAKLNVLNSALAADLETAFRDLASDTSLRAVILAGAGTRALIGGADIREMASLNPLTARAFITQLHNVCGAIRALPVPVIAQIGRAHV